MENEVKKISHGSAINMLESTLDLIKDGRFDLLTMGVDYSPETASRTVKFSVVESKRLNEPKSEESDAPNIVQSGEN